ncbi:MAG TPA: isoprenylcysteine carboxylmethyltransferase family protein [Candidatus Sulfotelmatobacter sp.]|nr:isoprenylcysteine carboxylmethyltransferase family protein [Candidatus Sulfotelmatobacter sp.]
MDGLYVRVIRAALIGTVVFFAVIFLPAGTLEYWQGWVFFGTFAGLSSLTTVYLARYDKPLLERRLRAGPTAEQRSAQKVITAVGGLVFVGSLVTSILDHRFGWSPAVPAWLSLLGDAFGGLGFLIYFLVIRANRYAAATVEVAKGQTVVATGPYAILRHPMYAGALLMLVWTPLALGSWWGLLSAPLFVGWFVWRLVDEEQVLRAHLPGYPAYTRRVRYRLVPYIW